MEADRTALAISSVAPHRPVHRRFYIAIAIVTIIIGVGGFAPSLVDTTTRHAALTPLVAVHGIVFLGWLLVFLAQTILAATRRISVHRRLGTAAMLLAPVLIGFGYITSITMARRGVDLSGDLHIDADPLLGLVNPLGDLFLFAILVAGGFWFRRQREIHKRLMLFATVGGLMPAPLAHLIGHYPSLNAMPPIILVPLVLLLFASVAHDRVSLGRWHPVSLWGAVSIVVWFLLLNRVIGPSTTWHHFAQRLVG